MVYFCPSVKCSFSCHAAEQKRTSFKAQAECIPSRHPSTAREIETRFNGNVKNEISISYGMMHGTRRRITTALCALSASFGVFVHEQLWAAAAPKRRAKYVNKSLRHTWKNQTHRHTHTHIPNRSDCTQTMKVNKNATDDAREQRWALEWSDVSELERNSLLVINMFLFYTNLYTHTHACTYDT